MSILIKGMELPECCDKCPLKAYAGSDLLVCKITGYRFYVWDVGWGDKPYTRHENCPLTEIPPHGDLIDRDALESNGWYLMRVDIKDGKYETGHLMIAPTIIPAEPEEDE